MERIECEKCSHSEFEEGDKLRCRLKKCQPEYEDMKEATQALLDAFPGSFINERNEFIAHVKSNQYFLLGNCEYPEDIDCKVLEWLSRAACKGQPDSQEWRNRKYRKFFLDGINDYMDTSFTEDEMMEIYTYLGNACNHKKTVHFIESGYDMDILKKRMGCGDCKWYSDEVCCNGESRFRADFRSEYQSCEKWEEAVEA